MKKVSVGLFFAVLWKGICQFLGSFFGLFGYKRDGRFAKIIWGMFATSTAVVMSFIALALVCALGEEGYKRYIPNIRSKKVFIKCKCLNMKS